MIENHIIVSRLDVFMRSLFLWFHVSPIFQDYQGCIVGWKKSGTTKRMVETLPYSP